jgi:hypothetical protein
MGMNRSFVLLLFLSFVAVCPAQVQLLPHDSIVGLPVDRQDRIAIEGWADYNSNAIFNELPWNIHLGGYIDRDLRGRSRDELTSRNSAGYDIGVRISWTGRDSLFGHANMRPKLSAGYRNLLGIRFASDIYELTFFGNAHYEDRSATIAPSSHTQMAWEFFGFGIEDARSRSFVQLQVIRGRQLNASDIRSGSLYTAPDGRVIDVGLDASYWQSDTAGLAEEHTNGLGAAVEGEWNLDRSIGARQFTFSLSVRDAGFVLWNDNSIEIERDTSFAYEGIRVDNIFALDELLIGEEQILDTFGLRQPRQSFTTVMPFRVMIAAETQITDRWHGRISVDQRYLPGYIPQVVLGGSRRFGDRFLLGATASYGGFGLARFGLAARLRIGNVLLAELGSTHVPGFFIGATRGAGAYFSLTAGF